MSHSLPSLLSHTYRNGIYAWWGKHRHIKTVFPLSTHRFYFQLRNQNTGHIVKSRSTKRGEVFIAFMSLFPSPFLPFFPFFSICIPIYYYFWRLGIFGNLFICSYNFTSFSSLSFPYVFYFVVFLSVSLFADSALCLTGHVYITWVINTPGIEPGLLENRSWC